MEAMNMELSKANEPSSEVLPFARSYQIEALDKAIKQNTIVFLETGSGKTLIAIMLLRSYAYLLRKPSPYIAVFLVPTVVLVTQQAEAVTMHTDLKVGKYWGEMGVDFWDASTWKEEQEKHEVLVMTPVILLDALRHSFIKLAMIKVVIFDECHNARGKHAYACIMKEFYHLQLHKSELPRIFGMTASPIKAKGSSSTVGCWKEISELENLMHSKVYTCENEDVLAAYIPFSTVKIKLYEHINVPCALHRRLADDLEALATKHKSSITNLALEKSAEIAAFNKLRKLSNAFLFCLNELGLWLALKAAEFLSSLETDIFCWELINAKAETIINRFNIDVINMFATYVPSGSKWLVLANVKANLDAGFITRKVLCLLETLLLYRNHEDLRCIIFVQRVVTAAVLRALLNVVLPELCGWKAEYIAGSNTAWQTHSRKEQNKVVEEFRNGRVNIIVATSVLEEGLDVQSCNLVIRFDPSATVCSFIQSRGRARMPNSDFVIMVKSGDASELSRVENYVNCGKIMRKESLRHASLPCGPTEFDFCDGIFYRVESTGAVVTLSSSVSLIYFYCSRLPSDGYFKPQPRCTINEESRSCTIQLPNSCHIQSVTVQCAIDEDGTCTIPLPNSCPIQSVCLRSLGVQGLRKMLKQLACLEACKKLHENGALTDYLVPDIVGEEALSQEPEEEPYHDERVSYFAPELVGSSCSNSSKMYHCYLIEMEKKFTYDVSVQDIILLVKHEFDLDVASSNFDLEVDRGKIAVHMKYVGRIALTHEQTLLCRRFQMAVFSVLLKNNISTVIETLVRVQKDIDFAHVDYFTLPCSGSLGNSSIINWQCVRSVLFVSKNIRNSHMNCSPSGVSRLVHTNNGLVCSCMLENCLVYTPHNGCMYCVSGFLDNLNGNSNLTLRGGGVISYKNYYKRYGLDLIYEKEALLCGRHLFFVQNCLQRCHQQKQKEPSKASVELPPELCSIIMSPISVSTLYTFSFVPSIMHRVESLLLSTNLRRMITDHHMQNVYVPADKVLEAITAKKCQESFHLESLETLGDSFLKYAVSQELFKTYQNHHEGLLSLKREKVISNAALCKLGCKRRIPGFIRNEPFDLKKWPIPGDTSGKFLLEEAFLSADRKMYISGSQTIKSKRVADAVEALIGAFLSSGGEAAALLFLNWLGIEVDFSVLPYQRHTPACPSMYVNVKNLESMLNYSFRDQSLLVEALTHGSYVLPGIPRCYQRLEFLGDSVLDHLITMHLYFKYPGMSPGLLTDLRSASVNNDCYALSALRAGLHKHILHASHEFHKQLVATIHEFEQLSLEATFGWESETNFPKVLADVIESLAGAIFVDSGYNKEVVFESIRPLLEPLITPETVKIHPVKELNDLCQKYQYHLKKPVKSFENGKAHLTLEVEANSVTHKHTCASTDWKTAKKVAAKALVKALKANISGI